VKGLIYMLNLIQKYFYKNTSPIYQICYMFLIKKKTFLY